MDKQAKIYVAGHRGLVGSAILKNLQDKGYNNIITRTHKELDLTNQVDVASFFKEEEPEYVFLAAAKVGGIVANNVYRADFIYENMMIQNNVIHQSYVHNVKKLLFLGSTCIYPKNAPQPMNEEYLLTDTLEYTNEPYAIAKIAGIKMCESYNLQYGTNFISVMPTNLYGPNDNFDLEKSHVLPALIRKIYLAKLLSESKFDEVIQDLNVSNIEEAKAYLTRFGVSKNSVEIWGSGKPKREFLWSEDMADACVFLMENRDFNDCHSELVSESKHQPEIRNTHINIGTGTDVSIKELAETIKDIIGFKGNLVFNTEKPEGTMRKLTDVSKLNGLGWKHKIELREGIERIYNWYKEK
ncbi:GDP-L-fucose synthase [Aestuariibaculum sp. M13]|uniref:GDP-L-fucose synthase family protein n=1 Tax=Aestuariibaculum sp. M13 TaxID=2967132 RepID=UPI002159FCD4|nr:GDP-L-fucose synthase [Aestuariibaculum sp. M13]MCR8667210.1 GDP-L-fucose synthase [Aestuariibaculum sp. M13]